MLRKSGDSHALLNTAAERNGGSNLIKVPDLTKRLDEAKVELDYWFSQASSEVHAAFKANVRIFIQI